MSRYDALRDEEDDSEVEDIIVPASSSTVVSPIAPLQPPPQSGGMVVQRIDRLTASLDQSSPTASDIQTCVQVLSYLGQNLSLLKLTNFKPIRAALQPFLEKLHWEGGNEPGNKGKKRKVREEFDKLAEKEKRYINQVCPASPSPPRPCPGLVSHCSSQPF
jgi:hypothetical protein